MITIHKATAKDSDVLTAIGRQSFIESHGRSAAQHDIDEYVAKTYTQEAISDDLSDPANNYHIITYNSKPAGYSKIILNSGHPNIALHNVTKMERLYLLQEFYDKKLGRELLQFNIGLSNTNSQAGMWLFVWTGNTRAVKFYERSGFEIIGSHHFKLTENHSNPNYLMFLKY
ncbi:MAG: GNAT family N-acetyltransferase [Bacteroidota bacterium]